MFGEHAFHGGAIGEIDPLERETRLAAQDVQAGLFQRRLVIAVEIVETDDGAAFSQRAAWKPMKPAAPVTNMD